MKLFALAALLLSFSPTVAQDQYTEGPVWDITYVRTKPDQRDAYLTSLKENAAPILEEQDSEQPHAERSA